jgi:hypothetical protein
MFKKRRPGSWRPFDIEDKTEELDPQMTQIFAEERPPSRSFLSSSFESA